MGFLLTCARCSRSRISSVFLTKSDIGRIQLFARCFSSKITDVKKQEIEVYYGNLTPQIKAVKMFSLLSSVAGLAAQPILYQNSSNLGTPIVVALFGFVGFFTFVTPFLLHSITKKYVTHIYFDSDTKKYSAIVYNFFLMKKTVTFTKDEVVVPDIPGMFTSFQVKGRPLFVDPRLFGDPSHYVKIMGYDKPIDFKLGSSPEKSSSQTKKET